MSHDFNQLVIFTPKRLNIFLKLFASTRHRKTISVTWQTHLLQLSIEHHKRSSLIAPYNQPTHQPPKRRQISLDLHTFRTEMKVAHFQFGPTNFKMIESH